MDFADKLDMMDDDCNIEGFPLKEDGDKIQTEFFIPMIPPTTQWKAIEGYRNKYEVSSNGDVRNTKTGRILKQTVRKKDGYLCVHLSNGDKASMVMVHRLVAEAFIPNPQKFPVVNHIDGNKSNPMVDNLEWTTFSGNAIHAFAIGLSHISDKCRNAVSKIAAENGAKTTSIQVKQLNKSGELIQVFPSIREAERITGIRHQNIIRACKSTRFSAGGYIWQTK